MREAPNCATKCEKRLVVRICAGNGLKCEYVQETAKSAFSHVLLSCVVTANSIRFGLKFSSPSPTLNVG